MNECPVHHSEHPGCASCETATPNPKTDGIAFKCEHGYVGLCVLCMEKNTERLEHELAEVRIKLQELQSQRAEANRNRPTNPRVPHLLAYATPDGNVIPTTIRQKKLDATRALNKSDAKHRHNLDECKLVKVRVEIIEEVK